MKTRTAALLAIPVAAVTLGAGAAWAGTQTRSTVQTHDGHAGSISQREQVMTQAQHAHRHAGQARVGSSDQVRDRDQDRDRDRDQVRDRDRDRDRDQVRDRDRDQVRDRDRDHVGGTTTGDASGPQAGGQHHGDEH